MTQPEQVFTASASARRTISRNAYLLFGVGAALLICGAAASSVWFATGRTKSGVILALAAGIGCAGAAGLLVGLVMLARLQQPMQVRVTPHRLIWQEGKRKATVDFADVVRVELVRDREQRRSGETVEFPIVRFIENDSEVVEFEVPFEDRGVVRRARFDARGITQAVLPHLPPHAVIAPTVKEFAQTGEVDLDLLPER